MTPRTTILALIATLIGALVLAACGGGDDDEETAPGNLTNPRQVPTATINPSPDPVIAIDPNAIQPLPPVGPPPSTTAPEGAGEASGTPAAGTCGPTYTVLAGDSPSSIAEKCGTTTQGILDANPGLVPSALKIGQVINLPQ
jgi:hypothetical protein